jgi:phosphatidate cytidylyltransferase
VTDRFDEEPRARTPVEGVRILGAEEAQAAIDARGEPAPDRADADDDIDETAEAADDWAAIERGGEPLVDLTPPEPVVTHPEPLPVRPRHFADEGPTWSASAGTETEPGDAGAPADPATHVPAAAAEATPLPHWTEPPTGAVPAIFTDADSDPDPDLDAWSAVGGGPRFRAEGSDWADADYVEDDLSDEHPRLGALSEASVIDEDEAFERDLAARRRTPRGRAARTMVTTPPAAPAAEEAPRPASRPSPTRPVRDGDDGDSLPPGSGRDLPTALITAAAVAIVALICFKQGTWWTALLAALIVGVGTLEFSAGLQARGFRPASALAMTGAFFLPLAARTYGTNAYPVFFSLIVIFSLLWFLWEITPGRPLLGVATTVFSFAYVGGLGGFAGLLLASHDGIGLILGVALCVITYDVAGYFVGSQFGKSPIAPRVSPNKSFEGTLAGMLGSVLMGWLFVGGALFGGIFPWSPGKGAVLGLFVAAGAFLGDLCESMLKRDLGIKDFGSLLPGHGGVLDRFDSLLFCLPITFFLALHLNIL